MSSSLLTHENSVEIGVNGANRPAAHGCGWAQLIIRGAGAYFIPTSGLFKTPTGLGVAVQASASGKATASFTLCHVISATDPNAQGAVPWSSPVSLTTDITSVQYAPTCIKIVATDACVIYVTAR